MPTVSSTEIAELLDSEHSGEGVHISRVDSLESAGPDSLAFSLYEDESAITNSEAGVVICLPSIPNLGGRTLIRSAEPREDFVRVVNEYFREWVGETEIHPSAVVTDEAHIGEKCIIGPNVYIGPDVRIGDRCKIQAGTSIGGEGFGFYPDDEGRLQNQIHKGSVVIEDGVEMGSNCSIDRGVFDATVIGAGTKMDNLIHIAHNSRIGEDVWIADAVAIQGSVTVGDRVEIHPNAAITHHGTVDEDAVIAMNAAVLDDVAAGDTVAGVPAESIE